ncbi:DNA internalization-related competence protein ComEC/Rec2 [Dyella sp. OK004]|uniref:DNA internalization-related competence protein ComEC/Rec2 n=1 Tax=Dyella sp. OK004 TaxID=1855292 RepID=UPI000B861589|nr:DNA internalization-related competence protein ComEC/Rec2 [Dyella sp. OK004]
MQWLPILPPRWISVTAGSIAIVCLWLRPRFRWLAWIALGAAWASWCGSTAMQARLPRDLEGRDFVVTGAISDLPQVRKDATRFVLTAEQVSLDGRRVMLHGRLRVAWYVTRGNTVPVMASCSRWRLSLRLKRPRGLVNPGGGDSERTALERGIVATGYVREDAANAPIGAPGLCINAVRDGIARDIASRVSDVHAAALLKAFAVGDTRDLNQRDWEVARANGVSHLIAISGFHVGVAAIAGIWLLQGVYWVWPGFGLRMPCAQAQALAALWVAALYSALAGFGLPTVRTLLMIAVVALMRCLRRQGGGAQSLALALIVILAMDPLAVLSAGFWLSFVGVAFLMLCLSAQGKGLKGFLGELSMGQLVMTLSLLPLTLWFFGEASLVGALSNLIAVPFVSFVIVPLALLGMLMLGLCPPLAAPVFWLAAALAHGQWWLLERMAGWPGAHWYLPEVRPWALVLATLGAWWLFLPRGVPLRGLGGLMFLPLLWPPLERPLNGGFQLWMLDVGQGLSVILRTRHHALVYDTGARYPSEFDLGEAAVLPSLRALGMDRLDVLMVSHADNDHAGGTQAVAAAFPAAERLAGEPARMPLPMLACEVGQAWDWDGVRFRVLSPSADQPNGKSNDRSCVLLVEGTGGRVLLTGDIDSQVESRLAKEVSQGPPLVLQVPHHGSRHSSSVAFISGLKPQWALVSAGWRNRFGHPHPAVVARYTGLRVPLLNTADQGAIQINMPSAGPPLVAATWRVYRARYWRE